MMSHENGGILWMINVNFKLHQQVQITWYLHKKMWVVLAHAKPTIMLVTWVVSSGYQHAVYVVSKVFWVSIIHCIVGSWLFLYILLWHCEKKQQQKNNNNSNRCYWLIIQAPDSINNILWIIPLDYHRNLSFLFPNGHSHLHLGLLLL